MVQNNEWILLYGINFCCVMKNDTTYSTYNYIIYCISIYTIICNIIYMEGIPKISTKKRHKGNSKCANVLYL